ncbi:uncharacterized protein LOC128242505 [Mya arenaria]|uniref:uncharacterized protein LOC128242505 n=1 Tax=Mya arenaria TaxID=6604 RepID=UPI0022E52103|nr:uncharacterized protein LOC128242505 [Mya arenaria]
MDKSLLVAWFVLAIHWLGVSALIGLRPANQTPHKDDDDSRPSPTSPKPHQSLYSQLHSPYELPKFIHNYTIKEISNQATDRDGCDLSTSLQCSARLLRQAIANDTDICNDVETFGRCVICSLRNVGRREFVMGVTAFQKLHIKLRDEYRCHGNTTPVVDVSRARHLISKRQGDSCCIEQLSKCSFQTYLKIISNRTNTCSGISYLNICMNENVCGRKVILKSLEEMLRRLMFTCQ